MHFSINEMLKNKNKIDEIENFCEIFVFINVIKLILIFKIINVFLLIKKFLIQLIIYFETFLFLRLYKNL